MQYKPRYNGLIETGIGIVKYAPVSWANRIITILENKAEITAIAARLAKENEKAERIERLRNDISRETKYWTVNEMGTMFFCPPGHKEWYALYGKKVITS